jgi:farnesyl diphosphate synthase
MAFDSCVNTYTEQVEQTLDRWLPARNKPPARLHEAMRYSVLGGGKRIRPLLIYATGEVLGVPPEQLNGPAAAMELIHAYSLVHDDLPAMDDDNLRRGKPSTHKAYGEATAVLVGDALQALAFFILAADDRMVADSVARMRTVGSLAAACGSLGMTGGQALDLAAEGATLSVAELEAMYTMKTGVLIRTSILMAGHSCLDLADDAFQRLDGFGKAIGLAFQIRDDILDIEGETEIIGKQQGADNARGKATYPAQFGAAAAKRRANELYAEAMDDLAYFGKQAEPLRWMSNYIIRREY